MTRWFGEPWPSEALRSPVCEDDAERIPVPVGASCIYCSELVDEDDRGVEMIYVTGSITDWEGKTGYVHIECQLRQVLGGPAHLQGRCICCGGSEDPDLGMSPRKAAQWVWEHYQDFPLR